MAQSKNKDRSDKAKAYGEKVKKQNAQSSIPKTNLIPQTEWQSTDILEVRGDMLESLEKNLTDAYNALKLAGQAYYTISQHNIQAGKMKLVYYWNNGEKATDEEVKVFTDKVQEIQRLKEQRENQMKEILKNTPPPDSENATGLITPNGAPLTEENLEEEKKIIV